MGITSLLEAHCTLIERTVVIRHHGYRVRVNVSFMNRKALGFFAPLLELSLLLNVSPVECLVQW